MKNLSDQETIEGLRKDMAFNNWLLSILTMMIFNGDKWHFAYNVEVLLEEINAHIARLSDSSEGSVSPVRTGAIYSIYHESIKDTNYPNYLQILYAIKDHLLVHWNGAKKGKVTFEDVSARDEKNELISVLGLKSIKGTKK